MQVYRARRQQFQTKQHDEETEALGYFPAVIIPPVYPSYSEIPFF